MKQNLILVTGVLVLVLALAGSAWADDPDWGEQRKTILMTELKAELGLSDAQVAELDTLAVTHRQSLIDTYTEIGAILKEIRILREQWEENFDEIVALQFDVMVKEYERGELWEQFAAAVTAALTEEQAEFKRLVMKVLDEAYRLSPPRHRPDGDDEGADLSARRR